MIAIQCGQPHCIAIIVYKYCQYYIQELGYTGMQFIFIWIHRPMESIVLSIGGLSRRSAVWADGSCSRLPS